MTAFEYRVTSAPRRGAKAKGVRTPEARFAFALEAEINRMAAEGWEYVRSDTLPCEERQGWLRGRTVVSRTVLVFRRARPEAGEAAPVAAPAFARPAPLAAAPSRAAEPAPRAPAAEEAPLDDPAAAPTRPPFLSPPVAPGAAAAVVPPPILPPAAPSVAAPPARDAGPAPGPAATTILAAPRRVQAPPPFRPRGEGAGEGAEPASPPVKPFGKASGLNHP